MDEIDWSVEYDPASFVRGVGTEPTAGACGDAAHTPDAVGGAVGSKKRGREGEDEETELEGVPILLMTILTAVCDEEEGLDEEEANDALEAQAACDVIREDVWTDPLKFYKAYRGGTSEDEV